ncbi:MAG: transposase [Candidatus Obscuribacter sp.]|nr:transposase [Candidatus Obscuribacter sp.]
MVLDFEQGSTENSGICRKLLSNLIDRGILHETGGVLFVIDGGKGIRKAIREVFGNSVAVQRCTGTNAETSKRSCPSTLNLTLARNFLPQ